MYRSVRKNITREKEKTNDGATRGHCWIERFKIKDFEGGGDGSDDGGGLARFEILGRKHESEEYIVALASARNGQGSALVGSVT